MKGHNSGALYVCVSPEVRKDNRYIYLTYFKELHEVEGRETQRNTERQEQGRGREEM